MLCPPPHGWKQGTFYLVRIAYTESNPIHRAIFYCGFLRDKQPGSYSCILHPHCSELLTNHTRKRIAYFEVVRELISEDEFREDSLILLPREAREPHPDIEWII